MILMGVTAETLAATHPMWFIIITDDERISNFFLLKLFLKFVKTFFKSLFKVKTRIKFRWNSI
jgi:hypothetical protein